MGRTLTMGLILVIVGLLLWLLGGFFALGIALIVIGLILFLVPMDGAYGYRHYRRRP